MITATRAEIRQLERENLKRPLYMARLSPSEYPAMSPPSLLEAWRSRDFLAQVFRDPHGVRVSINRTMLDRNTGRWDENISWDELMLVKRQIGFGDRWAYEVFPPDKKVVNVANMRHLWIPDAEPSFGWNRPAICSYLQPS